MKIHFFQRYHEKEHVAIANMIRFLSGLYKDAKGIHGEVKPSKDWYADGFEISRNKIDVSKEC